MSNLNDLIEISGGKNFVRSGDVIFIHEVGGHTRKTVPLEGAFALGLRSLSSHQTIKNLAKLIILCLESFFYICSFIIDAVS